MIHVTDTKLLRFVSKRRIGFWGVAFKPGTDDTRESPILKIVSELLLRRSSTRSRIVYLDNHV
ncbi:MAG: hypothetical protein CL790_04995 [Chloroflexi bacterium]|nr:hypothetical protein [Chloroflexota bacterium]HCU73476.1 hypothetical protein [Chloroflexota bacterium]